MTILGRLDTWASHLDERRGFVPRILFHYVDWHLRRASRDAAALDAPSRWRLLRAYGSVLDRDPANGRARRRVVMLLAAGGAVGGAVGGGAGVLAEMNILHHSHRVLAAAGAGGAIAVAGVAAGVLVGALLGRAVRRPEHPTWPEFVRSSRGVAPGLDASAP